jgi:succinoglycan biosynthesis protein ExoO
MEKTIFNPSVPVVSVVMPAHNAERTIGDAVRSVLSQTYENLELVICDDCSDDRTVQIIDAFLDDRVQLIRNLQNSGPGPARDRAISVARGTWVTLLDADDQFTPRRLETLIRVAEVFPDDLIVDDIVDCHDTPAGLVPWRPVWDERNFPPRRGDVRRIDFLQFLRQERLLVQPFFRRERARQVSASHGSMRNGEDLAFLFSFFAHGSVIRYVPKPMYLYRMTAGSLSTRNPDRYHIYRCVLEQANDAFAHDTAVLAAIDAKIVGIQRLSTFQEFFRALRAGDAKVAWRYLKANPWVVTELFRRAFRRLPFHIHRILHGGKRRRVE